MRTSNLSYLDSEVIGTDAKRFLHQTRIISEKGSMPQKDFMRSFPIGRSSDSQLTFFPYLIAYIYRLLYIFIPKISLEKIAIFYPIVFSTITWFILYALVSRLLGKATALLTINLIVITPVLVSRSSAGYADRDSLCLFLGLTSYYLYICSYQSVNSFKRLSLSTASGIITHLL